MLVVTDGDGTWFEFDPSGPVIVQVPDEVDPDDVEEWLKEHNFRFARSIPVGVWEAE